MNRIHRSLSLAAILGVASAAFAQTPLGSAFTYQGTLIQDGQPVTASADMAFKLYSAANGGTQIGSTIIFNGSANPTVPVQDGQFTVSLDFGNNALTGDERFLEVAVRAPAGVGSYVTLTPRQRVSGAPYAVQTRGLFVDDNQNVGVGTLLPGTKFQVNGNAILDRNDATDNVTRWLALMGGRSGGAFNFAELRFQNFDDDAVYTGALVASKNSGGASSGDLRFSTKASGSLTERAVIDQNGNFGLGVSAPITPFALKGNGGTFPVGITQNQVGGASTMEFTTADGANTQASRMVIRGGSDSAAIEFYTGRRGQEVERMRMNTNGYLGVGNVNPLRPLDLATTTWDAARFSSTSTIGTWVSVDNTSPGGQSWDVISTGDGNSEGGGKLLMRNRTTSQTALTLKSDGTASVKVLEITGGADIAEPFNVSGQTDIQPGMLVAIDPDHQGELTVCKTAYDHRVAGIISGANGVNPGMMLKQTGTAADGKHPVALTGRVWCLADADASGAIQAGDLLTTSTTPGHAMKAADRGAAGGAIIGKAMSSLQSGRGYILVLVSLQ